MEEEDDDFYAPQETTPDISSLQQRPQQTQNGPNGAPVSNQVKQEDVEEDEDEEEDEEEEESDSDIDIITEHKDGTMPEPPPQPSRYSSIKNIPTRTASSDATVKAQTPIKRETTPAKGTPPKSGAEYPAVATSTLDVDAIPIYGSSEKKLTDIDIDEDLAELDKPWRRPGSDISDYFNYGFDEFTWATYCLKQKSLRKEVQDQRKQMDDMQMMLGMPAGMPGLPGMPSMPGAPAAPMPMPPMPGMPDMPPEMMQQMAQFMAAGMDPTQMDPSMFMQQPTPQMPQGPPTQGGPGGQPPGFGAGNQGFGQPNQQQMGFGFNPMMGGDANANRGNFNARNRGAPRRNW
ncbi:Fip1-domain-containing protein [Xylona heveae TC161]|uniref:Fip1-domain-containing protein n=1 Tax=Xylona heveae (strain CBS 132557 / TC161) TaxID=1328760 RepID=A0A164ZNS4_XYLHT|nr:Fip1-domain-containing protein [Xylona heveae TC161]KZF19320.1 Fip1-domain-containing protein [Xylona heveae TC161]